MKITKEEYAEGCLEGKNVWDYYLSEEMRKEFIYTIAKEGKLIYNTSFKKPFFRIIYRGKYTLKGVEGKKSIRAILPEKAGDEVRQEIKERISSI